MKPNVTLNNLRFVRELSGQWDVTDLLSLDLFPKREWYLFFK